MTHKKTRYIDSETYRKMLVRDGDRRFTQWHTRFLHYQQQFLKETQTVRPHPTASPSSTVQTSTDGSATPPTQP